MKVEATLYMRQSASLRLQRQEKGRWGRGGLCTCVDEHVCLEFNVTYSELITTVKRAGNMAQLKKCLLDKHEDPSVYPSTKTGHGSQHLQHQHSGMLQEAETGDPWTPSVSQSSQSLSSRFEERPCL